MSKPNLRLDQAIASFAKQLAEQGIDTAKLDARLLVAHGLGLSQTDLLLQFDRPLSDDEQSLLAKLVARRLEREPIAHITGEREFWGLSFHVTSDSLVPRPDSETLIEAILAKIDDPNRPLRIIDIGVGSGCLLAALLSELPNAFGIGVDIAWDTVSVARRNISRHGLSDRCAFMQASYLDALAGPANIVLSNPPYLAAREFDDLEKDVACYDPYRALVSGDTGLEAYDAIINAIARWAEQPEIIAFEIGYRQAQDVQQLAFDRGFGKAALHKDLGSRDRVLLFEPQKKGARVANIC